MSVKINKEKCIGCGSCERLYSEYFKIVENKSTLVKSTNGLTEFQINKVIRVCPVGAIERE
jgi:ferredoxin